MAKRNLDKDISSMTADEILRATGNMPAPDAAPIEPDPEPIEVAPDVAAVAAEMGVDLTPITGDTPPQQPPAPITDPVMLMLARINDTVALLAQIVAKGTGTGSENVAIERLTGALERMTAAQVSGAKDALDESRRAFRPSNTVIPNVSVFDRRGSKLEDYKKPPLKCLMMIPWLVEWESVTREEVELLNLLEPGTYTIKRADRSKITVDVVVDYKADKMTPSTLKIVHASAFNRDNFRNMPPLSDFLRGMLMQHDRVIAAQASVVLTDEEEEVLIETGQLSVSK